MTAQAAASSSRPAVGAATLAACALVASLIVCKATRDGLFLSVFSPTSLPAMMTASAVASLVAVLVMARAIAASSPGRVLYRGLAVSAISLLGLWPLAVASPRLGAIAVHLHLAVFGATLVSAFWSHLGECFDPYTAKRALARVGVGAGAGGLLGGTLAWAASRHLPIPALLGVVAVLSAAALLLLRPLQRLRAKGDAPSPAPSPPAAVSFRAAALILRDGSYVRDLALTIGLGALIQSLLDFSFSAQAAVSVPAGPALVGFFAIYQAGVGVAVLVAQTLLARRSLEMLGLAGTVTLRPAAVAGLGGLALVFPGLPSLILARGTEAVLTSSLFRSGYELLFTPVPPARKRSTKTLVDVGFDKLGSVLGGLLTLAVVAVLQMDAPRVVVALAVLAGLLSIALARRLHRGYLRALEDGLRSGVLKLEAEDVSDGSTRFLLSRMLERQTLLHGAETPAEAGTRDPLVAAIVDLRAASRAQILRVLPRDRDPDRSLVPFLIPLLARDDVGPEVLRALRRIAPRVTGQLLDALLDVQENPVIRRRVPRVLVAAPGARTAEGLLRGLEDSEFEVRHRCALALATVAEKSADVVLPREAVLRAVARELSPAEGSPADGGRPGSDEDVLDLVFTLLSLVFEREPVQLAARALKTSDRRLLGTALEYLETVLPDEMRRALFVRLRVGLRERGPTRPAQELLDELLKSSYALQDPPHAARDRPEE